MFEFLKTLQANIGMEPILFKLLVAFLILVVGYAISKGIHRLSRTKVPKPYEKIQPKEPRFIKAIHYIVLIISIMLALIYLTGAGLEINLNYQLIADVVSFLLILVLVYLVVLFVIYVIEFFFDKTGILEFLTEHGQEQFFRIVLSLLKLILYIIFLVIGLRAFKLVPEFSATLQYFVYILIGAVILFVFYGLKDTIRNYSASIYLRSSKDFKLGQRIEFDGVVGNIKEINTIHAKIELDDGGTLVVPNKILINDVSKLRGVEIDLESLAKIKDHFIEQRPSFCGPASMAMILEIFGYKTTQDALAKKAGTKVGKGTRPEELIRVAEELTDNKVTGAWVSVKKITDLRRELLSWLDDGALIICDFKKEILMPGQPKAHYAVCVAIVGDDLLMLDPNKKKGGVYFVNHKTMLRGMDTYSAFLQSKRGFIVVAPFSSRAQYRIKKNLVYSDTSLYTKAERALEEEMDKLEEQSKKLESILPTALRKHLLKIQQKEKVKRIWKP